MNAALCSMTKACEWLLHRRRINASQAALQKSCTHAKIVARRPRTKCMKACSQFAKRLWRSSKGGAAPTCARAKADAALPQVAHF
jgi:hypothetical protein